MKNSLLSLFLTLALFAAQSATTCLAQGCPTPTNITVSNITQYSARVSWTGTANSYRILVTKDANVTDPENFFYWDIDTVVTTNPATIDIIPNTRYYVYVQCRTYTSTSAISPQPASFESSCGMVMFTHWSERFESGTAATSVDIPCWINENISGASGRVAEFSDTDIDGNSTMKMVFPNSSASLVSVTMPSFSIPAPDSLQYEFSIYRDTNALPEEGVSVIMQNSSQTFDTTFVPVNISVAGGVGTETAPGWYSYTFIFTMQGYNTVILLGYNNGGTSTYIDNMKVRAIPTCANVSGVALRDNQPNNTVVEWTADTAGMYHVVCANRQINIDYLDQVPAKYIVYNNPMLTADSVVITGLTSGARYYVYVRGMCTGGQSDWSNALIFRTSCAPVTVSKKNPYTNSFEDADDFARNIPCWNVITSSTGTWPATVNYPEYARTGDMLLFFGGDAGTNDTSYVVMSEFTNPVNTLRLRFWLRGMAYDASENDSIIVGVMSDPEDESTFTPVARFHSSLTAADEAYDEIEVLFDTYSGPEGRIAIMRKPVEGESWTGSVYYGSAIDDITIDPIPSCARVTEVAAHNVMDTSVTLTWHNTGASYYYVLISDVSIDPKHPDTLHVAYSDFIYADSAHIPNLQPLTKYYVYIVGYCSNGEVSDISKEYTFITAGQLPYIQRFETVGMFPDEMTEYFAYNLDSVIAGAEIPEVNPYPDIEVNDIISADTITARFNFYGDENFRLLSTPSLVFDGTAGTTISFDVCKRDFTSADPASDGTNHDDLFYVLASDAGMTQYTILESWTNDSLGRGDHSLRNDIGTAFSHWSVDLSSLSGSYRILLAFGSLEDNDDYDIHFDNIVIAKPHADTVTITVTPSDLLMGVATGSGRYCFGDSVTITAVANAGYRFTSWSDNDTNAVRSFIAIEDLTLVANFVSTTAVDDAGDETYVVYSADLSIVVVGASGHAMFLYDAAGRLVAALDNASHEEHIRVNVPGIYFLRVAGLKPQTIVVR